MFKFAATVAAAVTASALLTAPAGAAELRVNSPTNPVVHISLAGKSPAQINREIDSAANVVCGAWNNTCITEAVNDAKSQLQAIARVKRTPSSTDVAKVDVTRTGPTTIRVSLQGKSPEQIDTEINGAAHTVCKATNGNLGDVAACVDVTLRDARARLRLIAQADQGGRLAAK